LGSGTIPAGVYIWNGTHWTKDGGPLPPPVITSLTFDKTIVAPASNPPTLSITAETSGGTLTYQWEEYYPYNEYPEWATISAATTASYTVPGNSTAAQYRCVVDNGSGVTTTSHVFNVYICENGHYITDTEGHCYCTGHFGTAAGEWMTMNLRSTGTFTETTDYNFPNATADTVAHPEYGLLYTWSTTQTICPSGWHLPSDTEWQALITAISNDESKDYSNSLKPGTAGERMKSIFGIDSYQTGGTSNASTNKGFDAFLVGYINSGAQDYGLSTGFWTDASYSVKILKWDDDNVTSETRDNSYMYSVRCKKNS
jgi:uncharacterized protein (TIGR02145 family)